MSNTEFDPTDSILTLLTGEQYQTQSLPSVGGTLIIKDRKLKDVVVKRVATSTLHVIYKDGTVEVLGRPSSSEPYKITEIDFENGERLSFRYLGGGPLEKVLDQNGNALVVFTYIGALLVMADVQIEGGRYARTRIAYGNTNNQLISVTVPYDSVQVPPATPAYKFTYHRFGNGLIAISDVTTPMGGSELISYEERGHSYANGAYIPRVVGWRQTPGANQRSIGRKYSYSPGANYTGFPFSGGFLPGQDNLYLVAGVYNYWCDEILIDLDNNDAVLCTTRCTYNKFHLMAETQVTRNGTRTTTTFAYNEFPGKLFPDQPANLQLPKQVTERYELVAGGASRIEVQAFETDDYGNTLSYTEPSGKRTEYSYYPITGETNKCPADPHGLFQRYLKQERLIPVGSTPAPRLTDYTHTRVPLTGARYLVVQESISQAAVFNQQHTYYDAPAELAGRLKASTCTIDGKPLVSELRYTVTGDTLSETRKLVGREGQSLESIRTLSLASRRLLSIVQEGGSTLTMAFDASGRLTSEKASIGNPQEAGRTYAYHFATAQKNAHLVTTDAQGNRVIDYFDGLGRRVSQARLSTSDVETPMAAWKYNVQEQLVESVTIDYLPDGLRTLTDLYTYNSWGNISSTSHADGRVTIDDYDPLLNRRMSGVLGGERVETFLNEHGQPAQVNCIDTQGNCVAMSSSTYDGFGRCTSKVDHGNQRTDHYFYDRFDRVELIREVPADGSPARERKMEYAPGTSGDDVTAIAINGTKVAGRYFDSLARLTSHTRGQAATTWSYETGWTKPVTQTSPQGTVQTLTYDKELNVLQQVKLAGHPDQTFLYDPTSANLAKSTSAGLVHEVFYDDYGYPKKELHTANSVTLTAEYSHSPGGRILHHTAADNQSSQYDYDLQGRFIKMTAAPLSIEQGYNTFGQPDTLTTVHGATRVNTIISYDGLGRERLRRFEQDRVLLQTLTSTYHPSGLLATRVMHDANGQVVTGDAYEYDAFGRLRGYTCQGRQRPVDRQDRDIAAQQFTYDAADNLTKVVTTFVDGSEDVCLRYFTGLDPSQLTRLTYSNPVRDITLTYDEAGNLQNGPQGQVYTFDGFGQLTRVQNGVESIRYEYDAEGRQCVAARDAEPAVSLAYVGDRLDTLAEGTKKVRYFEAGEQLALRSGGLDGPQLHVTDAAGSVRGVSAPGQAHVRRHYTPYGDTTIPLNDGKARTLADLQVPAFNGERLDLAVNLYHLGNGRRAYDPDLKLFLSADPLCPFDAGLSAYGFCNGDPINQSDPSGLFPTWLKWALTGAALALGVVALGIGVAGIAAVGLAAATAAQIVGVAGTALGVIGSTLGVTALSIEAVDAANGWDRSRHIRNLGWAAFGFSMTSWGASAYNAWGTASNAYKAGKQIADVGERSYRSAASSLSVREGMRSAIKSFTGRTFKVNNKITPGSKAFGSIRAVIRVTNLMRSLNARYAALTSESVSAENAGARGQHQTQPQPQWTMPQFVDMQQSVSRYYEAFSDEVERIRKPILSEAYQEASGG